MASCGIDPGIHGFDTDPLLVIVGVVSVNPVGDLFWGPVAVQLLVDVCDERLVLLTSEMSRLLVPRLGFLLDRLTSIATEGTVTPEFPGY
jgi:hypothetical protein